jgi:large subunit ribosomal protein L6
MSRLGKLPIELPQGTQAKRENDFIIVTGPNGELRQKLHDLIKIDIASNQIKVLMAGKSRKEKALWGLFRSLINNMVIGVNQGYEKRLEINGVGYRASVSDNKLTLSVGYSHLVIYKLPDGINAKVDANLITISGIDKQSVGEVAAQIRRIRKPEPYKGKGIKYIDEVIKRKVGKTAVKEEK